MHNKLGTFKILLFAAAFVILSVIAFSVGWGRGNNALTPAVQDSGYRIVRLAGVNVKVDVAQTREARVRGLGGPESLAPDEGTLFIFEEDSIHRFWMKNMNFAIDILWISSDGKILDMKENVQPATYPSVFTPRAPARFVLELSAGFAKAHNVKIGDTVGL